MSLGFAMRLVSFRVHQIISVTDIRESEQPSPVRIGIDLFRSVEQFFIDFRHSAADRRIDVGDRLDGFHIADRFAFDCFGVGFRQVDEDQIAEGVLGKVA